MTMNIDEVIERFKHNAECLRVNDSIEACLYFRQLAEWLEELKTLKREPCTDAVSREEALKEMQKYHDDCAKTSVYTRLGFETAMNVVRELPPVTPERPKGEWKSELKLYGEGKDKYECSICHRTIKVDSPHERLCDYPFCHCGAEMRGVSE